MTVTPVKDVDTTGTTSPITVSHTLSPTYGGNDDLSVLVTVIDTTPTLQLLTDPEDVTEGGAIRLAVRASRAFSGSLPIRLSLSERDNSGFDAADIPGGLGPTCVHGGVLVPLAAQQAQSPSPPAGMATQQRGTRPMRSD